MQRIILLIGPDRCRIYEGILLRRICPLLAQSGHERLRIGAVQTDPLSLISPVTNPAVIVLSVNGRAGVSLKGWPLYLIVR